MAGKEQDSFLFRGCHHAVTSKAVRVIHKDFFGMEADLKL
jgi:hypothetical protein